MDPIQSKLREANLEVDSQTLEFLRELDSQGMLTIGWPTAKSRRDHTFLTWSSTGIPSQKTTSIVSSRLGRQLDCKDAVFRVIRSAIAQLDSRRQMMLSVEGTTTHPFVSRACELFGVPMLKVRVASRRHGLAKWAKTVLSATSEAAHSHICFVSNSLVAEPSLPIRDRIEVLGSDQLLVLHARTGGNLCKLLNQRLNAADPPRVFLAIGDEQLVPSQVANDLMDRGAVGWLITSDAMATAFPMDAAVVRTPSLVLREFETQANYFSHCTRRAHGAWPDQPQEEYLDQLIFGEPARDRSSLAALMRIVGMQRLLASGDSIRDATPVVSFTAAKLDELSTMRKFRSHRGRWDFEPYGLSIESGVLESFGAKQVIYGEEEAWETLGEDERPFFQKLGTQISSIDWSIEKEWRLLGDLDLTKIPPDKAIVFVPTLAEAKHVARVSRWPVLVVD